MANRKGVPVTDGEFAVADLPPAAEAYGRWAFATDGRKGAEGAGSGTGVMVFSDGINWVACDSGATVAA